MAEFETISVYRSGHGRYGEIHLYGPNPGTPYTACGLDAGSMLKCEQRVNSPATWCSKCVSNLAVNYGNLANRLVDPDSPFDVPGLDEIGKSKKESNG